MLLYGSLKNSKRDLLLGATIDRKLIFVTHLLNITENVNIKFNVLTRVQKYMTTDQKNHIFSSFIKLVELTAYMNDPYALFNKTTTLISKYFLRMQMKNQSTKNALNSL